LHPGNNPEFILLKALLKNFNNLVLLPKNYAVINKCPPFWVLFFLFISNPALSQLVGRYDDDINLSSFPYHIMTYGTQHGLPVNQVEGLGRDRKTGALVLATANGLHQFNGYEFTPYRNHPLYSSIIFLQLFSSNFHEHLLGYNYIGQLYHLGDIPELLGVFQAVDIQEDYFLTIDSLGVVNYSAGSEKEKQSFETGILQATFIHRIHPDTLLISDQSKTYQFLPKTGSLESILNEPLLDVKSSKDLMQRFFLTRNKLLKISPEGTIQVELEIPERQNFLSMFFKNDALLINGSSGLYYYFNGFVIKYSEDDILPTNGISTLFNDDFTGTLFMGTVNKGLMKLTPKRVINLFAQSNDFLGSYGSLAYEPIVLFAIAGSNIIKLISQNNYEVFDTEYKGNATASLSIIRDTLFVGTWGNGVFALSKENGKILSHQKLGGRVVHATYQDPSGKFWVGTDKGVYTGKNIQSLTPFKPEKITTQILTFYRTKSGHLWLGGGSAIYHLDQNGDILHEFGSENGLNVKEVRAFYEDTEGRIWIGTYQGGLFCFQANQLIELAKKPNYMLGNDVFTLVRDQFGNMLMSSNNGIQVIHERALEAYLNDELDYLIPYHLGVQSGVFNTEFNGGFFNNHININGNLIYFPSAQGIVFYLSRQIQSKEAQIFLQNVFADGQKVTVPEEIARTVKQIRFDFYDITYNEFDNVFYQYRLEQAGKQSEWSEPIRSTSVQFDFLPPGNYVFEVRAINGSNDPNPKTINYSFRILPYFYERTIVQILVLVVVIISLFTIYHQRNKKKQQLIQRELEIKNTISQLELNAIHAQMNPHMIFNSLNVLLHLIRSKSFEKAQHFTLQFAQLLRNILERSGNDFIEVEQEINLLENYLEIQKIRFQDAVSYRITCGLALRSERIPAMLVQPLVENAIVHGLSHSAEGGSLEVRFEQLPGFIRITVEDDGIGREQSGKIQEGKKRKSMGMELIRKKMDLIKSKYGISIQLTFEDVGKEPRPGTRAILLISQESSQQRN
jgi:hypothetical protein